MIEPIGNLEVHSFRCFSSSWDRVRGYVRHNQNRWDNESHFVRCAIIHFMKALDAEKVNWNSVGRPKKRGDE